MQLHEALSLHPHDIIAAVGAGGKTTLLQRLAAELAAPGAFVVFTTTTAIWEPAGQAAVETRTDDLLAAVSTLMRPGQVVTVACERRLVAEIPGGALHTKLTGVSPDVVQRLAGMVGVDYVLVEADGARGLSLKAPAAHEPVIPPATTHVLAIAGIEALGEPLTGEIAHRPELIAALLGVDLGTPLTPRHIALLLAHPQGGRKGVPDGAHFYPFINKVQDEMARRGAQAIAAHLRRLPGITHVLIGAALAQQPVLEKW